MNNNSHPERASREHRRRAFRIEELRQNYGEGGLTIAELAALAGVAPALVSSFERTVRLPLDVDALFRLAFALQVPVESLINERELKGARFGISRRRQVRDGGERSLIGFAVSET